MYEPQVWLPMVLELLCSPMGTLLFIPLYALWVMLLLPGIWVSMLAGLLYGTWWGSCLVFVGACLGAELVFIISRRGLRDWSRQRLAKFPQLLAIEQAVSQEGLKLIVLTRLSPAFPFSLLNLAYGLSGVSFRDYTVGLIGVLPGTLLFCALGALAGDISSFADVLAGKIDPFNWLFRLVGVMATVGVIWLIRGAVKRVIQNTDPSP
ncbi:TVP38/TMEM64 family protein [cyanobiont of Ornithocercus magnificus]|nr:TVP38/TMEM64 family protein [cyanobiont of Ornithocercus magnificus]